VLSRVLCESELAQEAELAKRLARGRRPAHTRHAGPQRLTRRGEASTKKKYKAGTGGLSRVCLIS
jgi:hypothetical protein